MRRYAFYVARPLSALAVLAVTRALPRVPFRATAGDTGALSTPTERRNRRTSACCAGASNSGKSAIP